MRKIYPSGEFCGLKRGCFAYSPVLVGAAQTEDRRVEDLQTVLIKLPKVNLLVLDAVIKHLKE